MIRPFGPSWFLFLGFFLLGGIKPSDQTGNESEIPVITVIVKDALILNPLKNFKGANLTHYQFPVLYLELDIGKLCLVSEGLGDLDITNPRYYFVSDKNPECTQLVCQGPPGPAVEAWTRSIFIKYLSRCVYLGYGEETIRAANFTKSPLPTGFKLAGTDSARVRQTEVATSPSPQLLEIFDPDKRLDKVLTPVADMVFHISGKDLVKSTRLLVSTLSFSLPWGKGEANFCWFRTTLLVQWVLAQPNKEELMGKCTSFCTYSHGMLEGEAWDWEEEDLISELWSCLGASFYISEESPFFIERDHKLGKIILRPRREKSDELRGNENGPKGGKRVEL